MKRVLIILFALMAVGGLVAQDFIMNNNTEPQSLDPSLIQGVPEHHIYMSLFEGLVINDPKTAHALPGVAEKWSTSPDGMTLTFNLRHNAKWSDGHPVTAQDFVYGWLRTLDPDTGAQYAYMIGMVVKGANDFNSFAPDKNKSDADNKAAKEALRAAVGVVAKDNYTLVVTLSSPAPYAIDMMAHYAFSPEPKWAIDKYGSEWIKPGKFIGDGPFVLKEWAPQDHIKVVKSNTYWDARNVHLKSITFLPIEDNKVAYNKFENGEIDWDYGVPLDLLDQIKLRADYQVAPEVGTYYFIFNTKRAPVDNVLVRKALSMAVDKKTLVDKITKGGQVVADTITPDMPPYKAPAGNPYNVAEAKKLLAQAGYPDGKGFPPLTIIYNTSDAHKKICEYVQAQWKDNLGIDVSLQNVEWKTFLAQRSQQHDFQVARAGWIGDYLDPQTFLDMFESDSGNNDGQYTNAKYDNLVKNDLKEKSPQREKTMAEAEKMLIHDDQAIMPIYFYVSQSMIDTRKWGGWFNNPLDIHNWKFIYKK
ncbi:MAG: peptide ABC transporter substrate-binding protein [Treponema sp.]|nr:peptide ABC transporter substrate-binding protein [Treponema sp.]